MLYRTEAFEPLTGEPWNDGRVRAAVREIVADTDAAFDPVQLWPAQEWDGWQTPLPLTTLYVGAAGVLWALDALRRRGLAEPTIDLAAAALRCVEAWREEPDLMRGVELPAHAEAGLLSGETGILLVACRLAPSDDLAADLRGRVRESLGSEANEIMWGAPGTLLAAAAMWEWTGDERWLERARRFAVHALEQVARGRAERGRGRGRYSLWTGDLGVAVFAADCLDGRARFPVLDTA